jgi:ABC-2 type transport system ATP-binding protein
MAQAPLAIEVQDVHKSFRIPLPHPDGGGILSSFRQPGHRMLHVLDGISFDVAQGEFFGIVGRNGSGKSTLLKLIASIYRADSGRIRVAGRLTPFLELGIGFNAEMTAEDNVILNGVMLGLTAQEARRRFDQIIEFAELEEFTDLELKNYSSGMRVRLAFAMLVQIESEILLIDEVLAVGDAAFQEKCAVAFDEMKSDGRTVVLVTHSMTHIQTYCDRAMLIHDGQIEEIGDPEPVTTRYTEINFERRGSAPGARRGFLAALETGDKARATIADAWVGEGRGEDAGAAGVDPGEPIELTAIVEIVRETEGARFGVQLHGPQGGTLFAPAQIPLADGGPVGPGERFRIRLRLQNVFAPGALQLKCGVFRDLSERHEIPISDAVTAHAVIRGPKSRQGILDLEQHGEVEREMEVEVVRG